MDFRQSQRKSFTRNGPQRITTDRKDLRPMTGGPKNRIGSEDIVPSAARQISQISV